MLKAVFPVLAAYMEPHSTVVVGVSGGPDSVSLLECLVSYATKVPLTIVVAHVNHGIRGVASDKDEKFVEKKATALGLSYEVKRVKLAGAALEEKGREVRRAFFEQLAVTYKAVAILTAHTQDDNVETILFNFLRGSGPAGLAGMQVKNGLYLKPLLGVAKKEILDFLKKKKIVYRIDATNKTMQYTRNYLRLKILPLLRTINPSLHTTLLTNASIFRELDEFLTAQAHLFLTNNKTTTSLFPRAKFLSLPHTLQSAVLQEAYRSVTNTAYRLPHVRLKELIRLIHRGIGKKKVLVKDGAFVLDKGFFSFVHS